MSQTLNLIQRAGHLEVKFVWRFNLKMQERLLCKAKRLDNKKWVMGYIIGNESTKKAYIHGLYDNGVVEVDAATVCQCLGLRDKNNQLIYEKDIVRYNNQLAEITWCDEFASWRLGTSKWIYTHFFGAIIRPEHVEVVGNIIDIPEYKEVIYGE